MTPPRRNAGPCRLIVDDALAALAFYRDVGLPVLYNGEEGQVYLQRTPLLLHEPSAAEPLPPRPEPGVADLTVPVDVPRRLIRQVSERSSGPVMPSGILGIQDYDGHVIALVPAPGAAAAVKRLAWSVAADDMPARFRAAVARRRESPHLMAFRRFHSELPTRDGVFYLFLTGGQLNWAVRTLSRVPAHVPVVVIGSALPAVERAWITRHLDRPFFPIDLRIDDVTAREFVFSTGDADFGWLGLDCLVLDDELFGELSTVDDGHGVNGVWWDDIGAARPVAAPALQFVSRAAVEAARATGLPAGPNYYSVPPYPRQNRHVPDRRCYGDVLTPGRIAALCGAARRSGADFVEPHGFLDATYAFQIAADALGYPGRRICDQPWDPATWRGAPSDVVCHLGLFGTIGFRRGGMTTAPPAQAESDRDVVTRLLREYLGLIGAERLPATYRERQEIVGIQLARRGIGPDRVQAAIEEYLGADLGFPARAVSVLLTPPTPPVR